MIHYYSGCYRIDHLETGATVPAGGPLLEEGLQATPRLIIDLENIKPLFEKADSLHATIRHDHLRAWMKEVGIKVEPVLFSRLFAFQQALSLGEYCADGADSRRGMILNNGAAHLSQMFDEKCAMCVELSIAAQAYLHTHGQNAVYVSGVVHWHTGQDYTELNEPHAYLMLRVNGQRMIYDPANPLMFGGKQAVPSVYEVDEDVFRAWEERAERGAALMSVENMISHTNALYGVNTPDLNYLPANIVGANDQPRSNVLKLTKR